MNSLDLVEQALWLLVTPSATRLRLNLSRAARRLVTSLTLYIVADIFLKISTRKGFIMLQVGVRVDVGGRKWYQLKSRPHIPI